MPRLSKPRLGVSSEDLANLRASGLTDATSIYPADLAELKALNRWSCWQEVPSVGGKKPDKPPIQANVIEFTGRHAFAKCNDPSTWASFGMAERYLQSLRNEEPACGLSFALNGDGIVGIDLDDCRNPKHKSISDWAVKIIQRLRSYTEISPSGKGIRIFLRGQLPEQGRHKGQIEVYDRAKFLSVTGRKLTSHGAGDGIEDRSAELLKWHREVFGDGTTSTNSTKKSMSGLVINDPPVINQGRLDRLFQAKPKAQEIFKGERNGYASQSEADLALANYAVSHGWSDQEVCDLLVAARHEADMAIKHAAYFQRTVAKAREGAEYGTRDKLLALAKQTPTAGGNERAPGWVSRDSRVRRDFSGGSPVGQTAEFLQRYVILPETSINVLSAWVMASWLADVWDRFPHLAITSPEKRCGKTRLLQLLELLTPTAYNTSNISPAALYRLVEQRRPTLLLDEAQSIARRGSEASEVLRELFNAGIDRNARVIRCGGEKHDQILEFSVYSPKVVALIGEPDGVFADRCLPIPMKRKTASDRVEQYRSRVVAPIGAKVHDQLQKWAEANRKRVAEIYDTLERFAIANDRMAELLLPLQAVLTVAGGGRPLELLRLYANALDDRDREQEMQSPGVRLLLACRDIFDGYSPNAFVATDALIRQLVKRTEESWEHYTRGEQITREALASLLRKYGIKSERNKDQTARGYFKHRFQEAWVRYLPTSKNQANSANPAKPILADCLRASTCQE